MSLIPGFPSSQTSVSKRPKKKLKPSIISTANITSHSNISDAMASGSQCQLSDLDPASLTNILARLDVRSLLSIQALFNRHLTAASRSPSVWLEQLGRDWLVHLQASAQHMPLLRLLFP